MSAQLTQPIITLQDLLSKPGEHAAIVGQTGTGKSFLAQFLLPVDGRLAIIDPKGMFDYGDIKVFDRADKILSKKPDRFAYKPHPDELTNYSAYDAIYKYCYLSQNIFVYTDEIVGVLKRTNPPKYLHVCYCMGRQRKVTMLSTFQRPAWIPLFLVTEASRFYAFTLTKRDDIKRMQEVMPDYNPPMPDKHTFMYYNLYSNNPGITMKLQPSKGDL